MLKKILISFKFNFRIVLIELFNTYKLYLLIYSHRIKTFAIKLN